VNSLARSPRHRKRYAYLIAVANAAGTSVQKWAQDGIQSDRGGDDIAIAEAVAMGYLRPFLGGVSRAAKGANCKALQ
jgi:hypothetical protein